MFTESVTLKIVEKKSNALISEAGILADKGADTLKSLTKLRKIGTPDEAAAAWEVVTLRAKAKAKLGEWADKLYMDRDGYEMASSLVCARYHASLFVAAGATTVLDLCAGIGVDAMAFTEAGLNVVAYELDPGRAVYIRANAEALGFADRIQVVCADVTVAEFPPGIRYAFFDPARRDGQTRRITDPADVSPPLSLIERLREARIDSLAVKLSPAIDRELGAEYDADVDFLSERGECKEALLRTGQLASCTGLSAVLLPSGATLTGYPPSTATEEITGAYLYEPDSAVIRAGLVGVIADECEGWLIDAGVAYILSDKRIETPFAGRYAIEAGFPYHLDRLQSALNERRVGRVIVKKRGFPEEPAAVRKKLKLTGTEERIVFLTHAGKRFWALIGRRDDRE